MRRAALALDLGRVGVSNAIWEKPGPFGLGDWERVRLHPYFTERAFAHSPALAPVGALAGAHHERLDGSGYHRKTLAPGLETAARILAAADCYQAMREPRPHRPALDAEAAEAQLLREAEEDRLCPEAVDAVLAAAGHRVARRPRELPAGLTERELEVLLALVSGADEPEDRREPRHLRQDRRAPRPAHLREGRRPQPRGRDGLGLRALARARGIGRSPDAGPAGRGGDSPSTSAPSSGAGNHKEGEHAPGHHGCRGLRPLREGLLHQGRRKRKQHGSQGATVFRDPTQEDRVWVVFDWDAEGWQSFVSDPEVPGIMQEAGHKGKPQAFEYGGRYEA